MTNLLLSCDWGTSSFRLRLVDTAAMHIIGEEVSQDWGVAAMHRYWKNTLADGSVAIEVFFAQKLQDYIDTLARRLGLPLANVPVAISGMASSSIGMKELPYAALPFAVDGSGIAGEWLPPDLPLRRKALLVSGISDGKDVLRGEETQMIGLARLAPAIAERTGVCIFPGTHSKHMQLHDGRVTGIQTYMTGELCHIMAHYSILQNGVEHVHHTASLNEEETAAFRLGVSAAAGSNLLHKLFSVRTNQLFARLSKKENFLYLSGLLIGSELHHLRDKTTLTIIVCCGSNLYHVYGLALETLDLMHKTMLVDPVVADTAVVAGHAAIIDYIRIKNEK